MFTWRNHPKVLSLARSKLCRHAAGLVYMPWQYRKHEIQEYTDCPFWSAESFHLVIKVWLKMGRMQKLRRDRSIFSEFIVDHQYKPAVSEAKWAVKRSDPKNARPLFILTLQQGCGTLRPEYPIAWAQIRQQFLQFRSHRIRTSSLLHSLIKIITFAWRSLSGPRPNTRDWIQYGPWHSWIRAVCLHNLGLLWRFGRAQRLPPGGRQCPDGSSDHFAG